MEAVKFPDMLSNNRTQMVDGETEAKKSLNITAQNLRLIILSAKKTLLGYPQFGTNLYRMFFESNNTILKNLFIDDIYTAIHDYMPQIQVSRENIKVSLLGNTMTVTIWAQNLLDFSWENYEIQLLNVEEM